MRLSSNAAAITRRMARRRAGVTRELGQAARIIAPALNAEAKRILQAKVYNVKIPTRGNGKPLWKRTANLKRQETARTEGVTVILANNADYASFRYLLGLPGHREPVFTLSVQWHAEAIEAKREFILSTRREAVMRALKA